MKSKRIAVGIALAGVSVVVFALMPVHTHLAVTEWGGNPVVSFNWGYVSLSRWGTLHPFMRPRDEFHLYLGIDGQNRITSFNLRCGTDEYFANGSFSLEEVLDAVHVRVGNCRDCVCGWCIFCVPEEWTVTNEEGMQVLIPRSGDSCFR